jgi:hypothetical protein
LDALVPPSPNVHEWFVIVPVDASVKVTLSGAAPLVGLAVKSATGAAAVTVIRLDCVFVDEPSGPNTVKLTENVPAFVYV